MSKFMELRATFFSAIYEKNFRGFKKRLRGKSARGLELLMFFVDCNILTFLDQECS